MLAFAGTLDWSALAGCCSRLGEIVSCGSIWPGVILTCFFVFVFFLSLVWPTRMAWVRCSFDIMNYDNFNTVLSIL